MSHQNYVLSRDTCRISRVQEVVDALDVRVTETIDFASARKGWAAKKRSTRGTNAAKAGAGKSGPSSSKSTRGGRSATKAKRSRT